jgi:PGAP1-like protein
MSRIIIGIHGLGNKPEEKILHSWWRAAVKEGLEAEKNFWFLKFELAYWASILHPEQYNPSITDKKDPLFLKEPYVRANKELIIKERKENRIQIRDIVNEQLDKIFLEDDGTFNFNGLTDFILRHFVKDLDAYYRDKPGITNDHQPRERICRQLANILIKNRRKKILLIAHSMGSIIAMDVLTKYVPDIKIHTLVTIGSPLGNPVVRSRMFSDIKINSGEKPLLRTPENIQSAWYNLADFKDKVAINYDLKNDFLPNSRNIYPIDKLVWNNYEYEGDDNPHKAYGYLRCPEMAEIIVDFLRWRIEKLLYKKLVKNDPK